MPRFLTIALISLIISLPSFCQTTGLTVDKIMRDPKWIGSSPSSPQWSADGQFLYFNWNPTNDIADSIYYVSPNNKVPVKASPLMTQQFNSTGNFNFNKFRNAYVYSKDNDVIYTDIKSGITKKITETNDIESNPRFSFNDTRVVYTRNQNLYAWEINTGETIQLTNIRTGETTGGSGSGRQSTPTVAGRNSSTNAQEDWLKNDQLQYFEVLRSRKEKREKAEERKANSDKGKSLEDMMAYIDENGNISSTPPDPGKKKK